MIELGSGIIASNLATLRPLYRWTIGTPAQGSASVSHHSLRLRQNFVHFRDLENAEGPGQCKPAMGDVTEPMRAASRHRPR